ncbi:hypothetical protein AVEN_95773-1 [Araneus ventricosus]|uniref:Uncharacterized protein n=1 Tax=Araneus ventricosus TaxID=182803 RepID=A0A4Y2GL55_ARAVE|nr:hypothetical protein AVEN_95773-1 [Araneus ventricosus]
MGLASCAKKVDWNTVNVLAKEQKLSEFPLFGGYRMSLEIDRKPMVKHGKTRRLYFVGTQRHCFCHWSNLQEGLMVVDHSGECSCSNFSWTASSFKLHSIVSLCLKDWPRRVPGQIYHFYTLGKTCSAPLRLKRNDGGCLFKAADAKCVGLLVLA